MMFKIELSKSSASKLQHHHVGAIAALVLISLLSSWSGTPNDHTISNCWEGFIWGLADPVIHLNCLAGVVAISLLSAGVVRGAVIAVCFVLAALLGIVIHLYQFNLSGVEIAIAQSVAPAIAISTITSGAMLVMPKQPNFIVLILLGVSAGLFQGYANAESIINAEMIPLVAYILGITLTQFAVIMSARQIGSTLNIGEIRQILPQKIRMIGFAFCAIGVVLLSYSII